MTEIIMALGLILLGVCIHLLHLRIKSIEEHWIKDLEERIKDLPEDDNLKASCQESTH